MIWSIRTLCHLWVKSPGHRWKSRRMFLCISCQRMAESSDLNPPNLMVISLLTMFLCFPWWHVVWLSLLPAHVYSQHSSDINRCYVNVYNYTLRIVLATVQCTGTRYFNHMKNIVSWSCDASGTRLRSHVQVESPGNATQPVMVKSLGGMDGGLFGRHWTYINIFYNTYHKYIGSLPSTF